MSHESPNDGDNGGATVPGSREVAHRLFAAEYADATHSYSESDEERAPNYVVTPTGVRVNRLFVVGVLTEVSPAGESMLRARVVDPTGAFVVYAGQYQPDAMAFLDGVTPPMFVAVTGKARTFSPDDADVVYTSIRPEVITEVDSDTRDRWTVSTAKRTLERIATVTGALRTDVDDQGLTTVLRDAGVDPSLAAGVPIAFEQYGTTEAYLAELQRLSLDTVGLVAEEIDAVDDLSRSPGQEAAVSLTPVIDTDIRDEGATPAEPRPDSTASPDADRSSVAVAGDESASVDRTASPDPSKPAESESTRETEPTGETGEEFDPEEFELDEEVRNEVQSEYGTEFSTAAEVDTSDETETPDVDTESSGETDTDHSVEELLSDPMSTDDDADGEREEISGSEDDASTASEAAFDPGNSKSDGDTAAETHDDTEEIDIMSVLLETMRDLDTGDGVDREQLIDRVSETTGVSEQAVSEAVQDALMSGQCYEPDDDTLKPI